MSTKKATKRALLTSILAICLCLVMLIGSTFAWFTDTASTSVNQIQSGTLDVALEMKDATVEDNDGWVNAEKKTLKWVKKADGTAIADQEKILWEPGCTYQLQPIRVKNDGNLALKYKIEITGIVGDVGLNKVIDWKINGEDIALTEQHLIAGAVSDPLVITGHMQESANNDYQNLTINGIAITVYATQLNSESDSYGPDYDINATYPLAEISAITNDPMTAVTDSDGKTTGYTYTNTGATVTATVPATAVDGTPTISIVPTTTPTEISTTIENAGKEAVAYEISVSNVKVNNEDEIEVSFFVGKDLKNVVVYHKNTVMTADKASYNQTTGFVTIKTTSFSPFTVAFDAPAAMADGVAYDSLQAALAAGGNIVLTKNAIVSENLVIDKATTLNLNGKTITSNWEKTGNELYALRTNAAVTIANGTVVVGQARALNASADLTLKNVTISQDLTGGHACVALSGEKSNYTVTGSTIEGAYALCVFADNVTLTIDNSKLEGKTLGLYHNGSNCGLNLNVTGTTINGGNEGTDATGVYISGSTTTRDKGGYQKATFTNCTIKGNAAVEVKYTDLTLNNCTAIATVTSDNASYVQNNNGATTNGFAVVSTDNTVGNQVPHPEGTITINGGSYTGLIGLNSLPDMATNFPGFADTTYIINK